MMNELYNEDQIKKDFLITIKNVAFFSVMFQIHKALGIKYSLLLYIPIIGEIAGILLMWGAGIAILTLLYQASIISIKEKKFWLWQLILLALISLSASIMETFSNFNNATFSMIIVGFATYLVIFLPGSIIFWISIFVKNWRNNCNKCIFAIIK